MRKKNPQITEEEMWVIMRRITPHKRGQWRPTTRTVVLHLYGIMLVQILRSVKHRICYNVAYGWGYQMLDEIDVSKI